MISRRYRQPSLGFRHGVSAHPDPFGWQSSTPVGTLGGRFSSQGVRRTEVRGMTDLVPDTQVDGSCYQYVRSWQSDGAAADGVGADGGGVSRCRGRGHGLAVGNQIGLAQVSLTLSHSIFCCQPAQQKLRDGIPNGQTIIFPCRSVLQTTPGTSPGPSSLCILDAAVQLPL